MHERPQFWRWPAGGHLCCALLLAVGQAALFVVVYAGANFVTGLHNWRVPIHFQAELSIPFTPWMVVVYHSISLLFAAAPFALPTCKEMTALVETLAWVTLFSGACFLLLPAELAYAAPTPASLGVWAGAFSATRQINLQYNLLPSLHVTYAVVCADVLQRRARLPGKTLLWLWSAVISLSTLLTHQHHLLDVIAGAILALAATRLVYARRTVNPAPDRRVCGVD